MQISDRGLGVYVNPTLRLSHEDMCPNFILEAIDKTLSEKGMKHALCSKI